MNSERRRNVRRIGPAFLVAVLVLVAAPAAYGAKPIRTRAVKFARCATA